jgi:hypothetical protein
MLEQHVEQVHTPLQRMPATLVLVVVVELATTAQEVVVEQDVVLVNTQRLHRYHQTRSALFAMLVSTIQQQVNRRILVLTVQKATGV